MQGRLIFLLEEPSMKALLEGLLPRIFPGMKVGQHFLCVPHQGKSDLDISIPRKLKAWKIPDDRFVILRDNDNAKCVNLKARFVAMCADCGRPDTLIRLVCQELESWYIGDLSALAEAFSSKTLDTPALRKRFREPDGWQKPSAELARLIPGFNKGSAARKMGEALTTTGNSSPSFNAFLAGLNRVVKQMESA